MDLAKYQKVEVAVLGLIAPVLLLTYTILLLLSGEAVFWGRSSTVIYHFCLLYTSDAADE